MLASPRERPTQQRSKLMTTFNFGLIVTQSVSNAIVGDTVELSAIHAYNKQGEDKCQMLAGQCPLVPSSSFTIAQGAAGPNNKKEYQLGASSTNSGNAGLTAGSNGDLTVGSG
jgi:hypothetical protein